MTVIANTCNTPDWESDAGAITLLLSALDARRELDRSDPQAMADFGRSILEISDHLPDGIALGMEALVSELRHQLKHLKERDEPPFSIQYLADEIGHSHTWLYKFVAGQAICMAIMNDIANRLGVPYFVTNFRPIPEK